MTTTIEAAAGELALDIEREIRIDAAITRVFESLLDVVGPKMEGPDGVSMHGKIEAWPGGRWFRDLGNDNGHYWATVQVIKRPNLLEMTGPLFMSYPAINHVAWRLEEDNGQTLLKFRHRAFGLIDPDHKEGVTQGWGHMLDRIKQLAGS